MTERQCHGSDIFYFIAIQNIDCKNTASEKNCPISDNLTTTCKVNYLVMTELVFLLISEYMLPTKQNQLTNQELSLSCESVN